MITNRERKVGMDWFSTTGRRRRCSTCSPHRAPALLESPDAWEALRQRAMIDAGKFTWARTAAQYVALYGRLAQ